VVELANTGLKSRHVPITGRPISGGARINDERPDLRSATRPRPAEPDRLPRRSHQCKTFHKGVASHDRNRSLTGVGERARHRELGKRGSCPGGRCSRIMLLPSRNRGGPAHRRNMGFGVPPEPIQPRPDRTTGDGISLGQLWRWTRNGMGFGAPDGLILSDCTIGGDKAGQNTSPARPDNLR